MIVLNISSHKLEVGLAAGVSTTPVDITVIFYDRQRQTQPSEPLYSSQESTVSSATVTTICNAPAEGITRNIVTIFGYNRDVTSATLAIDKNLSNASTFIKKHTLTTGQTLNYEDGQGWSVL